MTDQELQSLRNLGNEAEQAADEIVRLRFALGQRVLPLIDAAVAAERERCAKLCESVALRNWSRWDQEARPEDQGAAISADELADAIRGEQR